MENLWNPTRMHFGHRLVSAGHSGHHVIFHPTDIADPPRNILQNFVCYFDNSATGFVIAASRGGVIVDNEEIKALIVTAAHVACNYFEKRFQKQMYSVSFDKNRAPSSLYCYPLIHMLNDQEHSMLSPTSKKNYCLSNDICILGLFGNIDSICH